MDSYVCMYTYIIFQDWEETQIKQLVFTSRQINSLERIFNVALICSEMKQMSIVHSAAQRCFDHVENMYFYDTNITCSGTYINLHTYVQTT